MKDSGIEWIGEIPEHWKILKFLSGLEKKEKRNEDHIDRKMLSVSQYLGIIEKKYESEELIRTKEESQRYFVVEPGDLVVNVMWLQYRGLGVSSKVGIVSPDYQVYKINSRIIQPDFLHHLVRSDMYLNEYPKHFRGIRPNSSRISQYDFMRLPLLLPPTLEEQKQIADFLNYKTKQIDDNISKSERLIECFKEERQALVNQVVTKGLDPTVPMKDSGISLTPSIPEHWKVSRLKYVGKEPLIYGANESGELTPNGVRYIRITDIDSNGKLKNDSMLYLDKKLSIPFLLKSGDVLLARSGGTVGKSFLYDDAEAACFAGYLIRFRADEHKILPRFFYYFTQSSAYWDFIGLVTIQATIQNVSAEKYANLTIPLPPKEEQQKIIDFLNPKTKQTDYLIQITETQIKKLQEYRQTLISNVVTGKIDTRQEILAQ